MSYKFGKRSEAQLATCHTDLQLIMRESLKVSPIDFGIVEGHRSVQDQQKYFKAGKSKIDGIKTKSKHNVSPSEACDLVVVVPGKASHSYEIRHLSYLAGVIHAVAELLLVQGRIKHAIRWGGNWDEDGEIITDQTFQDLVNFELVNP